MAAAIPEAGAAVGGAAASRLAPGGGDLGGYGDRGSPAAFMLAIVLLGLALMGFWIAFHGPDELNPDQFPGLFNAFLRWVQSSEGGGPLAGTDPFATGSPASPQAFAKDVVQAVAGTAAANAYGATTRALKSGNLAKVTADSVTTVIDTLTGLAKKLGL